MNKQVNAASYYLADKGRMLKVANSFDITKSKISKIIRRVLLLAYIYLTKHHNYFANEKPYRFIPFIES